MLDFLNKIKALRRTGDRGATAAEYALIVALIVAVIAVAVPILTGAFSNAFEEACTDVSITADASCNVP